MNLTHLSPIFKLLLSLILALFVAQSVFGQTTWTGATSTEWHISTNWSTSVVPSATDDVAIPSGPVNQPIISTTAVAKSVEVQSGASLSISSAGSLTINGFANLGGYPNAFYNQGIVTNDGTMIMGNMAPVGQIGLRNTGTFTNTSTLQIDQITNEAIINGNVFTNTGLIAIGSVVSGGFNAIWNQAAFNNSASGRITIDRANNSALYNTGSNFVNSATITIGASVSVTGNGLTNEASFTNATGGLIQIDRTGGRGIANAGTFINAATINVGSLTTVNGWGLHNTTSGSFSNNAGGSITINRSGWGLINDGTFVNSASVTVGNVSYSGQDCLYNGGIFTNNATGEIRLDRGVFNGIWNIAGSFTNIGKIIIGSIAGTVTGILAYAPVINSGEIRVDRFGNGIITTNTFTNTGQITIGASASLGNAGVISTGTSATFINSGVGKISIDRTGGIGLTNSDGSTFINSATVTVGATAPLSDTSLSNTAAFSNSTCATLSVFTPICNGEGFTNAGFFTVSTTKPHSNTGTLTNNGVISYPLGNPIPNVINNALIIPSLTATCAATPALQIGVSNSISVGNTWYTDMALTTPGGTYNATTNTFTPIGLSVGNHTLYLLATDLANTCSQTLGVGVQQALVAPVSISAISTTLTCATTSLTLTATSSTTNLLWSTGATTNTISVSSTGVYSVTATDTNGCTATSNSPTISQNTAIVGFGVNSVSVCQGQHVNLLASGCTGGTVVWSTGTTGATLQLTAGSSTSTLTATCTIGSCSTTASGSVVVGGLQPPPAQILSLRADESACPVQLLGQGVGTSFVFTGPGDASTQSYVFSNVYRTGGVHDAVGLNVRQPGMYTLTVAYTNECGSSMPVSKTVTVNKACP